MKKIVFILFLSVSNLLIGQNTVIPDANFESILINLGLDSGFPDGLVPTANIDTLTKLDVSWTNVSDLTGIEDFVALTWLNCNYTGLTSLNVTQNTLLTTLRCNFSQLTSLNITQNLLLDTLDCGVNDLTNLDVTQNSLLSYLSCGSNALTSLDVTQNSLLSYLECGYLSQLFSLDVTQNMNLNSLYCAYNSFISLDITQNTILEKLWCQSNQLSNLDVTQNSFLTFLNCNGNQLTNIDVTQNDSLMRVFCYDNLFTELNFSQNKSLIQLNCENNQLSCLNVKNGNNYNVVLWGFITTNNPNLICIEVDDANYSTTNWVDIDPQTSFSTWCQNPCSVGINEHNDSSISIYPNPASTHFTIEGLNKPYDLIIYNSLGQLLYSEENILEISNRVDVITYSKGLLFVRIESDGAVYYHKLIKE